MDLAESIETIEAGYEFLLAYAAEDVLLAQKQGQAPTPVLLLRGCSTLWFSSATPWQNEKSRSSA